MSKQSKKRAAALIEVEKMEQIVLVLPAAR